MQEVFFKQNLSMSNFRVLVFRSRPLLASGPSWIRLITDPPLPLPTISSSLPSLTYSSSSSSSSVFPTEPEGWDPLDESLMPPETKIDELTISILERQSLVDFANEEGVRTLEAAIRFADQLHLVDTEGVDPMTSVQENRTLTLREDEVTCGGDQSLKDVLANAKIVYEDFFVAPPGNIALEAKDFEDIDGDGKKAKAKR